jgi:hypothetical protein
VGTTPAQRQPRPTSTFGSSPSMSCGLAGFQHQPMSSRRAGVHRVARLLLLGAYAVLLALPDPFHHRRDAHETTSTKAPNSNPDALRGRSMPAANSTALMMRVNS